MFKNFLVEKKNFRKPSYDFTPKKKSIQGGGGKGNLKKKIIKAYWYQVSIIKCQMF